jgi:hypothetical protein
MTIKTIETEIILSTGKTFHAVWMFYVCFYSFYFTFRNFIQHISGFFSLASIKKPPLTVINKTFSMVALLTKFKNGTQR